MHAALHRTRTWVMALLVGAGLAFTTVSQAKSKSHPVRCHAGYVRRIVRVPERKHGRIVRRHGKVVYRRVQRCVKVKKHAQKPKPKHVLPPPPTVTTPTTTTKPPPPPPPPPTTTTTTTTKAPPPPPPPPVRPANTTPPQVSGTTREGQTLSAAPGAWTGTPTPSFAYQWQRCDAGGISCQNIAGATASRYALGAQDVDSTLRFSVTASNSAGSASASSNLTAVIGLVSDPTAVAVGDIACAPGDTTNSCQQAKTATLAAEQSPNNVFVLGDNQYNSGLYSEYVGAGAYNATWGQFNPKVYPVPGNHEYTMSSTAAGYFQYFGTGAGRQIGAPNGYYSFNLGTWHIVALNSDCSNSGCADSAGGDTTSAQTSWLTSDLAANRSACVLAMWHHPAFSWGLAQNSPNVGPLWNALYNAHADVVLNGHDHVYERTAQLNPSGSPAAGGIREFVVGTGGESLFQIGNSPGTNILQAWDDRDFGVLKLTLRASTYDWAFINTSGNVVDSGSAACHRPGSASASAAFARDVRRVAAPGPSGPQLAFDARPLHSPLKAVVRRGLPVAIHCSRMCDVVIAVWRRRGGHLQRIATFHEDESEIPKAYSQIRLRLPVRKLQHLRKVTLVLRFGALDAAFHRRVVTRTMVLERR